MTDDEDRTQEIRRDTGRAQSSDRPGQRTGNTPPFGAPAAPPQRPQGPAQGGYQQPAQQARPGYRPGPGYQQAPQSTAPYGAPMLPADRGSGGFPAALVGAVVAALVAVATSFAGYQTMLHDVSHDSQTVTGFFTSRLVLLPWPGVGNGDQKTAFLTGLVIVLVVALLLMMVAAMSTRAGTGAFGLFLGAWMTVVLAGAAAAPATAAIWMSGQLPSGYLAGSISGGMVWGVLYGWIAALALVITHAMRRKPTAG